MPPPSLARNFFEQVRTAADPVVFIRKLYDPTSPVSETDWLDFKQPPRLNATTFAPLDHPKWKEMWMEALGGFANNQGGVLIWGLDARKDPATGVDAASGEVPVPNPEGVKSRLKELQRQATDPPLANVEIEAYSLPTTPPTGFVVCFIPEGPYKPYREASGRSQYPFRSGDNFTILSRSMLQSLFYPRSKAIFRAKATLSSSGPAGGGIETLSCRADLMNVGTATATNAQVLVESDIANFRGVSLTGGELWSNRSTGPEKWFLAGHSIHPGRSVQLFYLEWRAGAGHPAPSFTLAVYCENQERQVIKIEFDMKELVEKGECVREAMPVE
jgi:hypothetical protein